MSPSRELVEIDHVLANLMAERATLTPADMAFFLRGLRIRLRDARGQVEEMEIAALRRENAGQRSLLPLMLRETL